MIVNPLKLLAGWQGYAAVALIAAAGAWTVQGWRYGEQIAGIERDQAQALAERNQKVADAQGLARLVEHARQNKIEGIVNEANQKAADATASAAVAGKLRDELARIRKHRGAGNSAAANSGPPAGDPIGVLIGLLEGMEPAGREISRYADDARIAGLAREAAYDGVRAAK